MADYRLVESFDIDDGSLDALSNKHCFALGVEWAMVRSRILAGELFTEVCRTTNVERIVALAERHGRYVEHHPSGDRWSRVFIGASRA